MNGERRCHSDTDTDTHTHTHEYYTTMKKNEMPFATWMDLEIIILSKSEEDKCRMLSLICRISKK